jgi:serine/threonine-protein kinase RsbW
MNNPTRTCMHEGIHYPGGPPDWQTHIFVTPTEMEPVLADVLESLERAGFNDREKFSVRLALEEAIMNAIRHGHRYDRTKYVCVRYRVTAECLLVEIEDQGQGFDPRTVPDPRAPENLEREGGRGLFLMYSYMTWVRYNERGTCVTMCKCRNAA